MRLNSTVSTADIKLKKKDLAEKATEKSLKLNNIWYQKQTILWPLLPLSAIFSAAVKLRRFLYKLKLLPQTQFSVPVIVIGNLTVGGTGKTPLVIHIIELLRKQGFKPGIVSRGYGGQTDGTLSVTAKTNTQSAGDEAVLLANQLSCPIIVGKNRRQATQQLLDSHQVDVVVSDDGLQHYALRRQVEIAVVDGARRFGNGHCLPVGPLREPISRLKSVDLVINNGGWAQPGEYQMFYLPQEVYSAPDPDSKQSLSRFKGQVVHAVAGLGNPEQFFQLLRAHGLIIMPHAYPDHHQFSKEDIEFNDAFPVIMTEKDAVKCKGFTSSRHWVLPIKAVVDPMFDQELLSLVR